MERVLSLSEQDLSRAVLQRLSEILPGVIQQVIHDNLQKIETRRVQNGVWEPVPNSPAAEMWRLFEQHQFRFGKIDITKLATTATERKWNYKTVGSEFERWKKYYGLD